MRGQRGIALGQGGIPGGQRGIALGQGGISGGQRGIALGQCGLTDPTRLIAGAHQRVALGGQLVMLAGQLVALLTGGVQRARELRVASLELLELVLQLSLGGLGTLTLPDRLAEIAQQIIHSSRRLRLLRRFSVELAAQLALRLPGRGQSRGISAPGERCRWDLGRERRGAGRLGCGTAPSAGGSQCDRDVWCDAQLRLQDVSVKSRRESCRPTLAVLRGPRLVSQVGQKADVAARPPGRSGSVG